MKTNFPISYIEQKDIANMFVCAESFLTDMGYYLPEPFKINPTFFIDNSCLFLKTVNLKKLPENLSIPLIFARAFLTMVGFKEVKDIMDKKWIIVTSYNLMNELILSKCLFPSTQATFIDALLSKEIGTYILPPTVLPELIDYARKTNRTKRGDANKFSKKSYLFDPVTLGIEILQNFELKKCKFCKKKSNSIYITKCCDKPVHYNCALNNLCPRNCTTKIVEITHAESWKNLYIRESYLEHKIPQKPDITDPQKVQSSNEEKKNELKSNEQNINPSIFLFSDYNLKIYTPKSSHLSLFKKHP